MAASNGSLNGHANGKLNGNANGKMNGHAVARRRPAKRGQGLFARTFNLAARLTTWAAILTVLFRCPSSLEACDSSSPTVCKYYFQAKHAVTPHVEPYYEQYAAPYVNIAKPYYETVDNAVLTPVRTRVVQYGAPWVEKGQDFAVAQWAKNGHPQLAKLQDLGATQYEQTVGPYLSTANKAVSPYYDIARTNALQTYHEFILPGYEVVQPYAVKGFETSRDFTTTTALPAAYWTWNKTYVFIDTAVWPQLRAAYVENVEPQLVRIGERLGRYKNKTNTKVEQEKRSASAILESAQSSFAKPPPHTSSTAPSEGTTVVSSPESHGDEEYWNPVVAPDAVDNESAQRTTAREMVAEDLAMWQNKFAAQADEGALAMEDRVDEIAKQMMTEQAQPNSKALVDALESTIKEELAKLKLGISSIVESSGDDSNETDEEVVQAIRAAGVAIREKALAIREWRLKYDKELQSAVVTAADVHFEILDQTRGLALQKIGMKWAWTDGVTYKDWAKYHELKSTLTQWTDQFKELIVRHPTLIEAQNAAANVEDEAMELASEAARELVHLKEVSHYKILAKDFTDNFETEAMKLAAEAAVEAKEATRAAAAEAEMAKDAVSEEVSSVVQTVTSTLADASDAAAEQSTAASQSASSILSDAEDATSEASEELSSTAEDVASTVSNAAENLASDASSVASDGKETIVSLAEELADAAGDASSTASDTVSSVYSEASESVSEAVSSTAEEDEGVSSSFASEATEVLVGKIETIVENATDEFAEEPAPSASETPYVKPAMFGAAAQEVPERKPILDDYIDPDVVPSAKNAAAEAYASAVSKASDHYSSAASVISAQMYGTTKPVHEQLFASVSGAYENALAAASSKFSEATAQVVPTPTTAPLLDWEKAEAVAAQRLSEGRLWAEMQYSSALIAMGMATATPTAVSDKFYEQARFKYYAGLGQAQDRYSSFIAAASSAFSSITATPTPTDYYGTAASIASVAKESAASVVNAAEAAAGDAYAAAADTVVSAAGAVDESIANVVGAASEQIYIAGSAITENWDNVIAELSGRVYGEPSQIGWYDSLFSDASSYASVATEAVAGGASTATNVAGDAAATATNEAAKQYNAVSELVSELLHGKEPTFSESVLSRLGAAYSTAAANVENFASEASAAASSVGDKVGSAAGQATDVVKDNVQRARDEL